MLELRGCSNFSPFTKGNDAKGKVAFPKHSHKLCLCMRLMKIYFHCKLPAWALATNPRQWMAGLIFSHYSNFKIFLFKIFQLF
ncbi:hypothetical protein NMG60_11032939 [Bertholletia excelsa]